MREEKWTNRGTINRIICRSARWSIRTAVVVLIVATTTAVASNTTIYYNSYGVDVVPSILVIEFKINSQMAPTNC